jgi:hypothetical protein
LPREDDPRYGYRRWESTHCTLPIEMGSVFSVAFMPLVVGKCGVSSYLVCLDFTLCCEALRNPRTDAWGSVFCIYYVHAVKRFIIKLSQTFARDVTNCA